MNFSEDIPRICRALLTFIVLLGLVVACSAENTVLTLSDGSSNPDDTSPPDGGGGEDGDTNTNPDIPPSACDLSGTWAVRVWTISEAFGFSACANNWYYYEIDDQGDTFTVTRGASCAYEVYGSAVVKLLDPARAGLLEYSEPSLIEANDDIPNDKNNSLVGRSGTFRADGNGGCEFSIGRWWTIRGADPETYLPDKADYETATISSTNTSRPLPTREDTSGAEDWDNDSNPAITLEVGTPAEGTRQAIQRDWNAVPSPVPIRGSVDDFEVPMIFNNTETILAANPDLLDQTSTVAPVGESLSHTMRWIKLDQNMPTGNIDNMMSYCDDTVISTLGTRSQEENDSTSGCCMLPEKVDGGDPYPPECLFPANP